MKRLLVPVIAALASVPLIAGERATGQVAEETPTPTATATVSETAIPTVGAGTATPTVTATPTPTETAEPEPTDTVEPEPTDTPEPEPTATDTPLPPDDNSGDITPIVTPDDNGTGNQDDSTTPSPSDTIRVVIRTSHCVSHRTFLITLPRAYKGLHRVRVVVNGRRLKLKLNRHRQVRIAFKSRPRRAVISHRGRPTIIVTARSSCSAG